MNYNRYLPIWIRNSGDLATIATSLKIKKIFYQNTFMLSMCPVQTFRMLPSTSYCDQEIGIRGWDRHSF